MTLTPVLGGVQVSNVEMVSGMGSAVMVKPIADLIKVIKIG